MSLTIFKVGFLVESAGGFLALFSNSSGLPFHGYLLLLGPVFSAFGVLFLWVGRHEWNEQHHRRVGFARFAFLLSVLAIVLAAAPVAYLAGVGGGSPPAWLGLEFGIAIALVFALTFVTYALVAAHLVGRWGEVAMGVGLVWAVGISGLIGLALSPQLGPLVQTIVARNPAIDAVARPITLFDALLAFSYLAFFAAFADAHWRVARGRDAAIAASPPGP